MAFGRTGVLLESVAGPVLSMPVSSGTALPVLLAFGGLTGFGFATCVAAVQTGHGSPGLQSNQR